MNKKVVVTGVGAVSPLGLNVQETWEGLLQGESGVDYIKQIDAEKLPVKIAGEVKNFNIEEYFNLKEVKKTQRFIHFAVAGAREAISESGLNCEEENHRAGVCLGVGIGGIQNIEHTTLQCSNKGPKRVSPFYVPSIIANLAPGWVSIRHKFTGPNFALMSACASGTHAIGESFKMIQRGQVDVMVTGGADSVISATAMAGFGNMRALSQKDGDPKKVSRPFDKNRDGFVIAEGSGILVLEEMESAKKRGAPILAEIVGYGINSDAFHITKPKDDGRSMEQCMGLALEDAQIGYQQIDAINAHGTSTYFNDLYETQAIKRLFKDHAHKLSVSSTKSMTGHLIGAAGGLEAVISIMSLRNGVVPPTINYETPDPELDLDYTPNVARERQLDYILSNSFGFGGTNGSVIFRKV